VLIPFPHAAEDHQAKNAFAMERAGAAIAIREDELSAEGLASEVRDLLRGTTRRRAMAEAARRLGRPDAAAAIVDDLCAWLGVPADGTGETSEPSKLSAVPSAPPPKPEDPSARARISRRPKVRRAELRLKPLDLPIDITG
jgi:UDP-N-acetylglucosamine--N-acetylmuramyl-(pentapeptide) pyrophosphoryl-undecaprenol N-acetylglucosamine transferase